MSLSDAELEEQLKNAGKGLLEPHSSTDDILSRLDRVEELLAQVEQSPSKSMGDALLAAVKALISDTLFRHSDMEVKFSVVSCIAELTRISAPNAPYGDDCMKEVFQFSVAAFEKLSQLSGRLYTKAVSILDVVARVRSSVIMLDLECDALIFEMFQHFLNHIRPEHPASVFSNMEAIMMLVLEESEDIPLDLISLFLDSVKKENQEISPLSWKLGENVITNCATTLQPYLTEAVKSLGINVDDYAPIVGSICQKGREELKQKSASNAKDNLDNENKLVVKNTDLNKPLQETEELASDVVFPGKTYQTADGSRKPTSNGTQSTGKQDNLVFQKPSQNLKRGFLLRHSNRVDSRVGPELDSSPLVKADEFKSELDGQKPNSSDETKDGNPKRAEPNSLPIIEEDKYESEPVPRKRGQKKNVLKNPKKGNSARADSKGIAQTNSSLSTKEEKSERESENAPNGSLAVKADKSENEPDSIPKKRGRKPNSLMNPDEGYDHSWLWSGRKIAAYSRCRKSREKLPAGSPSGNSVSRKATSASTLENVAEHSELGETIGGPPSQNHSIADGTPGKEGQSKTKEATLIQKADTTSPSVFKGESLRAEIEEKTQEKEAEDTISAEKEQENPTKLGLPAKTKDETAVASECVVVQMEAEDPCHPEEKLKQSTMKLDAANVSEKTSVRRGRKGRKTVSGSAKKDISKASGQSTSFESGIKFEKSGKSLLKRNRVIGKEEASESLDLGELMVGRRIKVWWPMDKMFYEGVIDSYDPIKKRHKVCYDDGDVEVLNMKNQRWEMISHESLADEGEKSDLLILDNSSPISPHKKKQKTESDREKQDKDDSAAESNLPKGGRQTKSNSKNQVKKSSQGKKEKADFSPKSVRRGRQTPKSAQEKQPKKSGQAKARLASKSTPRGKGKAKSDEGTQVKKSNQEKQSKDGSSSQSSPKKEKQKRKSAEKKEAENTDQLNSVKADSSLKSKPQTGKRKRKIDVEKQAQAESSFSESPTKGVQKRKIDGGKQADKADESKLAKADASSESVKMFAPESNIESMKNSTKTADIAPTDNPAIQAELVDGATKTGEILKDHGQLSTGDLEADALKTTLNGKKASSKTVALSEGKWPIADIGVDGEECANELVEMSKVGKE